MCTIGVVLRDRDMHTVDSQCKRQHGSEFTGGYDVTPRGSNVNQGSEVKALFVYLSSNNQEAIHHVLTATSPITTL